MQVSLSLAHLMHTDMLTQLPLAWASESAHCHFLASVSCSVFLCMTPKLPTISMALYYMEGT
ncbi:hypothetical protein ID866_11146 [Astraeus odoratus]|nr:hypothetical protein ID866_11146 [Astraeus odoratus]